MARPKGYRLSTAAWNDVVVNGKKFTVTEVAALTGVNRASLSGLLGGHTRASLTMARNLADGLGVSAETLFPLLDPRLAADAVEVAA
jgi:transcriptional regulator with XRE-family HTH domain